MTLRLGVTYIIKTLWYYRNRILLILFGLIFALGLLFANIIWEQTSEELVLEDFNENIDYLASTSTFSYNTVFTVMDYLTTEPLVDDYDLSVQTNAIFNSFNKNGSYRYYPLDNQQNLSDPVDVITSLITSLDGMQRLSNILNITGSYPKESNHMMISFQAKLELERIYNITIIPGTTIFDIEIGRRFPETDRGEFLLENFKALKYPNVTISGIFERNGALAIADSVYSPNLFNNLVIFPITEQNFNLTDFQLMDRYGLIIRQMIDIDFHKMIEAGIANLDKLLFQFMERLKSRYWFAVGDILTDAVDELQVNYRFSFHAALLYYPLILLSLLLSHYGIGQLIFERNTQVNLLRIRGANDADLIKLYFVEYIVIGVFALIFGIPVAVFLAALIPSFQNDFTIDLGITTQFLNRLNVEFVEMFELAILTFTFYFLSVSYHIIRSLFLNNGEQEFLKYLNIIRFIITIVLTVLLYLILINLRIPLNPTSFDLDSLPSLRDAILYLTILWLFYSQYLTDLISWFIQKSSEIGRLGSPKLTFYLTRSLVRKKNKNKLIVFYLVFLFSILMFSTSLYSTYDNYDRNSQQFLQGAPLRIHTAGTYTNYTETLRGIDGVNAVTPILSTTIYLGSIPYTLYGVDADTYFEVGNWKYANGSDPPEVLLDRISKNSRNILVPQLVIDELDFRMNQTLNVFGLLGVYISRFNISGILNSAPGLGLAGNSNPEVSQNTRGWLMTSIDFIQDNYPDTHTNLFLAGYEGKIDPEKVNKAVGELENVSAVNPNPINQNFIGSFITTYLPKPKALLIFVTFITTLISFVIIILSTQHLLHERKEELALMVATGSTRQFVLNFLIIEFIIFMIGSMIVGILFGLIISYFALRFFIPFTLRKIFIPISLEIELLPLLILMLLEICLMVFIIQSKKRTVLPRNITDILMEREMI